VWGFHEAKLDVDAVKEKVPDVKEMASEAKKLTYGK